MWLTMISLSFLVYKDDIVITKRNSKLIQIIVNKLNNMFALKDLGRLNIFFGIQMAHNSEGFHLSQSKYI